MKHFLSKILRALKRIPIWFLSLIVVCVILGWIGKVFYVDSSYLLISTPVWNGEITITGRMDFVDLPVPIWNIYIPHIGKDVTCEWSCPLVRLPAGTYTIESVIPEHHPWFGHIRIEKNTVGEFLIPAIPHIQLIPITFTEEEQKLHETHKVETAQKFSDARNIVYNHFDHLALIEEASGSLSVYDMNTKIRHDLLTDIWPSWISKLQGDIILHTDTAWYAYDLLTSNISEETERPPLPRIRWSIQHIFIHDGQTMIISDGEFFVVQENT